MKQRTYRIYTNELLVIADVALDAKDKKWFKEIGKLLEKSKEKGYVVRKLTINLENEIRV